MRSELTNEDRGQRALEALIAWADEDYSAELLRNGKVDPDLLDEVASDMLGDLLHLLNRVAPDLDIDMLLNRGRGHFEAELFEEWLDQRADELVFDEHPHASVCFDKRDGVWFACATLPDDSEIEIALGKYDGVEVTA